MPIVAMPDGTQVQFPDDMPREQIRDMIATKFPDAAPTGGALAAAPAPEAPYGPAGVLAPVQFQEGTGKPRLAMPQLLTDAWNAVQAPGKALQGQYDQVEVNTETGDVSPFDPRMVDDAASLAGFIAPTGVATRAAMPAANAGRVAAQRAIRSGATPEIDDLYAAKDAAYKTVDQLGARYAPEAVDNLGSDMLRRAAQDGISPERHPKAYSMLVDWERRGPQGMSLTELDQMRQVIRRDLVSGGDAAEGHFGRQFISAIDDFIEKSTPAKISGVTGQTADYAIRTARKSNAILRKSERLQDALEAARLRAASAGSGGNIDNAIRQELVRIIKKPDGFSPEEIAQMERIVTGGGRGQELLRKIGKLSPSGSGLMSALGLGATMANPAAAAIPAIGLAAKTMSDRATQAGVRDLTKVVRTGGGAGAPPPLPGGPSGLPQINNNLILENLLREGPTAMPMPRIRLDA